MSPQRGSDSEEIPTGRAWAGSGPAEVQGRQIATDLLRTILDSELPQVLAHEHAGHAETRRERYLPRWVSMAPWRWSKSTTPSETSISNDRAPRIACHRHKKREVACDDDANRSFRVVA
jgi:hypothetical protein